MQLRHISPRSTDWMDAMDEGGGGRGWEKLAPEEKIKLRREVQLRVKREPEAGEAGLTAAMDSPAMSGGERRGPMRAQGFEPSSPPSR
jgi:hypothetical protein